MTGPILRILLRYLAGFLVAKGFLDADFGSTLSSDADLLAVLEIAVGTVIALVTETAYYLARRFGWKR